LHAAWSAAQFYGMTERDVILNGFPLFHVAGSLVFGLSTLLSGGEIVLPTTLGLRNASMLQRYWQVVERHSVSLLAAVPTVISMLLAVPPQGADLRSVRALLTGGSPLPPELAAAFEQRLGIPVRNILGMTESAGVVSIEPFHAERSAGSCGLRLPFTQVQAFDATSGTACAPGQAGTLRLRGPHVSAGYTDPLRNAGTFSEDGWLISGDLGHVDEQGRIFVTGRAKDVIIRGAHNIDPGLIEDCLMQHPEVALAAAVGAPDEYAGELPVAFVVLKAQATASPATLLAFCQAHIAEAPACPKRIDVLQALPLTAIGKVYKPQLRRLATERVLAERLAAAGLTEQVSCLCQDDASGLLVVFTRVLDRGAMQADIELAVRALMAPFAIRWRWTSD
jgi:fatty-acyl-CoA synthase